MKSTSTLKLQTIIALLFFGSSCIFAQTEVANISINLKKNRDVFQIVDEANKNVVLFLSDKIKVNAIKLNEQFIVSDSISTERPEKNYSEMCGYIQSNNKYKLFWSSQNSNNIQAQTFDFDTKKIENTTFNLELKNEKIIQKFSEKGRFYIVTVIEDTNNLKFYIFDETNKLTEKFINLDKGKFFKSNFTKTDLYGVLSENLLPFESAFSLQKITPESPTSLTFSSKKRKCYINNNSFIISIDTNPNYSQLININLSNFTFSEKIFKQPYIIKTEFGQINANSFLLEDKLYQIKLNQDIMFLSIKDLNDNILKEYTTLSDTNIEYKNSDIIQENGSAENVRILEKTSQFLRKINSSNSGISCYKLNDAILVKIGSVSEVQQNSNIMIGGMLGGFTGALIAAAISNPTFDNFNSYANRKVVYINCLFDTSGNHTKGDIKPVAFDKIQKYIGESTFISPTLFKLDSNYYLGKFNSKEKTYSLTRFVD